jgi:hypothetical protein
MTTKNFIIKEGRVCCTDKEVPEEPKEVNCGGTHACTCAGLAFESGANRDVVDGYDDNCPHRYTAALQLIKDNAVLIREEDQERAYQEIETRLGYPAKEGVLYPVSVEVEIGDGELCKYCNKSKDGHYHDTVLNRYACKAGDLVAALCTFHPQTVARIVEEPVKLPFKEFKVKAGSIKIEKRIPVVDIQEEEPVEKKPENWRDDLAKTLVKNSQVEDQEELRSTFTNPTENEVAEMVVSAYRVLIEHDKFAMMDYIFDKTKIRFLKLKENFGLDSGSLPFNEVDSLNKTKLLMDVWQKWCELDYEEFDGWLHSELHKNNP